MALTFGGASTDSVLFGNYTEISGPTQFTLAAWTYRTGAGGGNFGRIVNKGSGGAGSGAYQWYNDEAATTYQWQALSWSPQIGGWTIARPAANEWHHVAVTYDYGSTANDPLIYLDGVSQTVTEVSTPSGTVQPDTEPIYLGNRSDTTRNWAGRLAEFAIWNVILSANEVLSLGRGESPVRIRPSSLVFFAPLWGIHTAEPNLRSSGTGTVTGATLANHAPVTISGRGTALLPAVATAGGSVFSSGIFGGRVLRAA